MVNLAIAQALTGNFGEAVSNAAEAESMVPGDPNMTLSAANVYAIVGDEAAARHRLEITEAAAEGGATNVSPGSLAMVYAGLGDADRMFELLNRSIDTYDSWTFSLNYPWFVPYWPDPRFGELLDRLGLPREAYQ